MVQWFNPINQRSVIMTDHEKELAELAAEFESCRKILLALGDENRQHLILEMMKMGQCAASA